MRRRHRATSLPVVLAMAAAVAGLSGCGDTAGAPEPGDPVERVEALTTEERLATIEGSWMCDVARFAFDDLADIDAKLDSRLADDGFDRDDYDRFKASLDEQPELRQLVLDTFDATCVG